MSALLSSLAPAARAQLDRGKPGLHRLEARLELGRLLRELLERTIGLLQLATHVVARPSGVRQLNSHIAHLGAQLAVQAGHIEAVLQASDFGVLLGLHAVVEGLEVEVLPQDLQGRRLVDVLFQDERVASLLHRVQGGSVGVRE